MFPFGFQVIAKARLSGIEVDELVVELAVEI